MGHRNCAIGAETGHAVADVWEEARKALDVVSWSRTAAPVHYQWTKYERELHPETLAVLRDTVYEQAGWFVGGPFKTLDREALWREGFVRQLPDGGWVYEGPDASVFLSDRFAEFHCFEIATDTARADEIGLRFQPTARRDLPEIAGTFWLDRLSGELRTLEFQFVHLPHDVREDGVGGHIEFQRLPSGLWVVARWWIRMPLEVRFSHVILFKEEGAAITAVRGADQRPVTLGAPGVVMGVTYDSLGPAPRPLSGAEVVLEGTPYRTLTDGQGFFAFRGIPTGTYHLTLDHPDLETAPPLSWSRSITVFPEDTVRLSLGIPSSETLWEATCPGYPPADDHIAITGVVRFDGLRKPAAGATVAVQRPHRRPLSEGDGPVRALSTVLADQRGHYAICGVAPHVAITLRAAVRDAESDIVTVADVASRFVRLDLVVRRQ